MVPATNTQPVSDAPIGTAEMVLTVAIDLGAKTTGAWSTLHPVGGDPAASSEAAVVIADPDWLCLSQENRTQMRHMRRGVKRRKLAKRLVRLWLLAMRPDEYNNLDRNALEFLQGLMNRRGFTYFSLDEAIDQDKLDPYTAALGPMLGEIDDGMSLTEWLRDVAAEPSQIAAVLERPIFSVRKDTLRALVEATLREYELGDEFTAVKVIGRINTLRGLLDRARRAATTGHRHRTEYLGDIRTDLANGEAGKHLCAALRMSADELAGLIGHIGNWPLKALRGYFHDVSRAANQDLDAARFHRAWLRWIRSWSLSGESGERRNARGAARQRWGQLLLSTETDRNALWRLLTREPAAETIPPYESQANRRPPVCQSLLLDPEALDRLAPAWQSWASRLYRFDADGDRLAEIGAFDAAALQKSARNQGQQGSSNDGALRWRLARALQRVLDRTTALDTHMVRRLAQRGTQTARSQRLEAAHEELGNAIGTQHRSAFMDFARAYFEESGRARAGIRIEGDLTPSRLLRVCRAHPPHKDKILADLLSALLTTPAPEAEVRGAIASIGKIHFPSDATLGEALRRPRPRKFERVIESLAEQQKQWGGRLRQYAEEARHLEDKGLGALPKNDPRLEAWTASRWAEAAAAALGGALGHSDSVRDRYSNPYSMAQLHQILFVDRHGFSTTCRACTLENAWRGTLNADGIANAARLPADSVRPFDGMLARLLGAKANRLASRLAQQVCDHPARQTGNFPLRINLLIEENRFEFNEQLSRVKKLPAKKIGEREEAARRDRSAAEQAWDDKRTRIRDAAEHVCAYTGSAIGDDGEFDHIVSRAETTELSGYTFNSEANLIYVSRAGNREKGRSAYTFGQLHPLYVARVFDGMSAAAAEALALEQALRWLEDRSLEGVAFHQLAAEMQRAVRHALFIPDVRAKVLTRIDQQNRTRVNGTQRWFARQLLAGLQRNLTKLVTVTGLSVHRVPFEHVAALRRDLSLPKPEGQPPYSHVIDAALVYAVASTVPTTRADLGLPVAGDTSILEFTEPDRARALLPGSLSLLRIEREPVYAKRNPEHRPLLKAGLYGERFLPIAIDSEAKMYVGFARDNWVEVQARKRSKKASGMPTSPRDFLLDVLWPVLRTPPGMSKPDIAALAKLAASKPTGLQWLSIDRRKAFERWGHAMKAPDTLFEVLKGLRYCTKKTAIVDRLENNGKVAPSASELLRKLDFEIKIDLRKCGEGIHCVGAVTFPAKEHWRRLLDDPELAPFLGVRKILPSSQDAGQEPVQTHTTTPDWKGLFHRHFPAAPTKRAHSRTRQTWSLPVVEAPSGGVRLHRRAPDGTVVFQLAANDRCLYQAFARDPDDALGFDRKRLVVLSPFGGLALQDPPKEVPECDQVPFNRFLRIPDPRVASSPFTSIEIAPGSSNRRQVRLTLPWRRLDELLGGGIVRPIEEMPAEFKIDKAQIANLASALNHATGKASLGPRMNSAGKGSLRILRMDRNEVCLRYEAGSGEGGSENDDVAQDVVADSET